MEVTMAVTPDFYARSNMQRTISCLRDAISEIELVLARGEYDFAFCADLRLPMALENIVAAQAYLASAKGNTADLFRPKFDFLPNAEGNEGRAAESYVAGSAVA
jgi:hypothetical protein